MTSDLANLSNDLNALANSSTVTESLWRIINEIASFHTRYGGFYGFGGNLEDQDYASDFLLHLSSRAPSELKNIKSKSHLIREYKRWITLKQSPAAKELWNVISEALLVLEKEKQVERAQEFRRFSNSNKTRWYVKENQGKPGCRLTEKEVAAIRPPVRNKTAAGKLLSPAEAKQWLMKLLQSVGGEIAVQDIFTAIKPHIELFHTVSTVDFQTIDSDKEVRSECNKVDTRSLSPYLKLRIEEDIEFGSENIWRRAGELTRKIAGHLVLCCYWIPKNVLGKKVKLEQFGSHSSVKDVVDDITTIMREYLPLPDSGDTSDSDRLACLSVAGGIIERLSNRCSENGYCQTL